MKHKRSVLPRRDRIIVPRLDRIRLRGRQSRLLCDRLVTISFFLRVVGGLR